MYIWLRPADWRHLTTLIFNTKLQLKKHSSKSVSTASINRLSIKTSVQSLASSPSLLASFLLDTDTTADRCYEQAVAACPPVSNEQLKAFLEKVNSDTSLQEKLKAAAVPEAAIEIAKEAGFSITAEDTQSMQSGTVEVSDEELEGAAGGGHFFDENPSGLVDS